MKRRQLLKCLVNPPETLKLKLIFSEMHAPPGPSKMTGQRQPRKLTPYKQPKLPTIATYSELMRELFYMDSATNKPYHYCTSLPSLLNSFFKKDKD